MGITQKSLERIAKSGINPPGKMLILGCQNLYNVENYGELAHDYFTKLGYDVRSWDITGCQRSEVVDLREQQSGQYDYILQHGTLEHLDRDLYMGFRNCHDLLKVGGIVIHENPKTGNWPGHGTYYFTLPFYHKLVDANEYDLIGLCEEPAMGNITDGWNICVTIRKNKDSEFMSEEEFSKLDFRHE